MFCSGRIAIIEGPEGCGKSFLVSEMAKLLTDKVTTADLVDGGKMDIEKAVNEVNIEDTASSSYRLIILEGVNLRSEWFRLDAFPKIRRAVKSHPAVAFVMTTSLPINQVEPDIATLSLRHQGSAGLATNTTFIVFFFTANSSYVKINAKISRQLGDSVGRNEKRALLP